MTAKVFLLWHSHILPTGDEDDKLLGVFSTKKRAQEWLELAKNLPGFAECQEGFLIDSYTIDERKWNNGYFTDVWKEPDPEAIRQIAERAGFTVKEITMVKPHTGEVYGPSGALLGNFLEPDTENAP